jgi:SCY1-like protein 3
VRVASAVPPEEKDPASFSGRAHPHASDMWGFGQLILEINDELGEDDPLPTELVEYAETALTNEDPSERPAIKELLLHPSGRTAFTDVVEFLSDFTLKNEEDKKLFCKKMLCAMTSFPEEAVCHRLLPVLLTPPVMGDPNMLPIWDTILIPKSDTEDCQVSGFFSQQCFKREVLSRIGELFRSRENHVRVILLKYFEFYAILFPVEELEEAILPEILIGLREEDDHLVAGTLRALATLVILLGSDVVMGTSRSSVFSDSLPRNTLDQSSFGTPPIRSVGEYRTFLTNSSFSQRGVSSPSEPSALALREEKRRKRKEEQEMRKQKRMKERELRSNTGIASNRTISFADDVNPEGEFPESGAGEWDFPTYDQSHSLPHKSTTNNRTGGNGDGEGGEGDGWEDFDEDGGWKDFDDGVGVSGGNGDGVIREGDGWDDDNVWEDFEENAQHSSWRDDALHEDSHQKYDGYQNGLVGNDHYHDQWDVDDDRTQGLQQFGLRTNSFTRTISTTSAQSSSVINSPNENWDKVSLSSYTSGALLKTDSEPSKKTNQLKTDKKIKKMNTKIKNKQAGFDSMESPNGIQNRNGSSLSSTPQSWEKKGSKSNKKTKTQSKQPIFEPEPDYFAGMEPMV